MLIYCAGISSFFPKDLLSACSRYIDILSADSDKVDNQEKGSKDCKSCRCDELEVTILTLTEELKRIKASLENEIDQRKRGEDANKIALQKVNNMIYMVQPTGSSVDLPNKEIDITNQGENNGKRSSSDPEAMEMCASDGNKKIAITAPQWRIRPTIELQIRYQYLHVCQSHSHPKYRFFPRKTSHHTVRRERLTLATQ